MRPTLFITRDDAQSLLLVLLVGVAAVLAFSGAIAARRLLLELPADYLSRALPVSRSPSILRAIVAAALVIVGLFLLVLPGPGVLLIATGVLAWRTRPLRVLLARKAVFRAVNALRDRHGRPALVPASME